MSKILMQPCPFCGNPDIKTYTVRYQHFNVFKCKNCEAKVQFPNEPKSYSWNDRFYGAPPCEPGDKEWDEWHAYNHKCKMERLLNEER